MVHEFDNELANMEPAWSNAPENTDLPESIYTMTIGEAKITKTRSSGKLRAAFCYVVAEGEHLGAKQWDGFMLDPEQTIGMSFLKKLLTKLGYEIPASVAEISDILEDVTKRQPVVSAQVVRKGDFTNVRVLELLGEGGGGGAEQPAPKAASKPAAKPAAPTSKPTPKAAPKFKVGDWVAFDDADGNEIVGKVSGVAGTAATIETDDAVWEDIDVATLRASSEPAPIEEDEAETTEEAEEGAVEEAADLEALRAIAGAFGVEVQDDADRDATIAAMSDVDWPRDELTAEEVATLEGAGLTVKAAKPKPAAKPVAKPAAKPAAKPTAKAPAKPAKPASKGKK